MDYDTWERLSQNTRWPLSRRSQRMPDDVTVVPTFEQWTRDRVQHGPTARRGSVYGMVIEPDGTTTALYEPVNAEAAAEHIGDGPKDGARVHPRLSEGEHLYMLVDDFGHAKGLPVNPVATELYGTGWPVLGTVIVCEASDKPLPPGICERLGADRNVVDPPYHGDEAHVAKSTRQLVTDVDVGVEQEPSADMDLS